MNGIQNQQKLEFAQSVNQPIGIEKKCPKCKETKSLDKFYLDKRTRSGHCSWCKVCMIKSGRHWKKANPDKVQKSVRKWEKANPEKVREARQKRYKMAPERICERARLWSKANPEKVNGYKRKWAKKNHEKVREMIRRWQNANPEKIREAKRRAMTKKRSTPQGQLNCNISTSICLSLRGNKKGQHWEILVGYTLKELRIHLEKHFQIGMTWENYGQWHIDHRTPISAFNFSSPKHIDFKRCWTLNNLQPMWARKNMVKQATLNEPFQPCFAF